MLFKEVRKIILYIYFDILNYFLAKCLEEVLVKDARKILETANRRSQQWKEAKKLVDEHDAKNEGMYFIVV